MPIIGDLVSQNALNSLLCIDLLSTLLCEPSKNLSYTHVKRPERKAHMKAFVSKFQLKHGIGPRGPLRVHANASVCSYGRWNEAMQIWTEGVLSRDELR